MKILYTINGYGQGHLTQARAIIPPLQELGHDVTAFISIGNPHNKLHILEEICPTVPGTALEFVNSNGKMGNILEDYANLIKNIIPLQASAREVMRTVKPDLLLTSCEPSTLPFARFRRIPIIQLSHQGSLVELNNALKYAARLPLQFPVVLFSAYTRCRLCLEWNPVHPRAVPPILQKHERLTALRKVPIEKGKLCCYFTYEGLDDARNFLRDSNYDCYIYHRHVTENRNEGNLKLRKLTRSDDFFHDLVTSEGIISNTGFELPAECMFLGKKMLLKPFLGMIEHEYNAERLEESANVTLMNTLDKDVLREWLTFNPRLPPVDYPDMRFLIGKWIDRGDYSQSSVKRFAKGCWDMVYPGKKTWRSIQSSHGIETFKALESSTSSSCTRPAAPRVQRGGRVQRGTVPPG